VFPHPSHDDIYSRNRVDFDDWAAAGAADWGYDAVLPYFIKAEANERCTDQYHGKFGPLSVSDSRLPHELYDAFMGVGERHALMSHQRLGDLLANRENGIKRGGRLRKIIAMVARDMLQR
jgi:choline dehydrogenase-like flavoprotein